VTSLEKGLRDFAVFAAKLKGDEKSEAQTFLFHLLTAFCLFVTPAMAEPPRLVVRPYGTNQLELVASALREQINYMVLARTNSPTGHWLGLAWIRGSSNSTMTTHCNLSEASKAPGLAGLTLRNLANWTFTIGVGEDSDGNGLPDVYEDLVTRSDPYAGADPYADPDGDGWTNLQEMQNGTDPLRYDAEPPPPSGVSVARFTNGTVKVTWSQWGGAPDYFLVERAERKLQPGTNVGPFILQPPSRLNRTNMNEYLARQREIQRRFGRPFSRRQDASYVTGPFRVVAQVLAKPGQHDYTYTETNVALTPLSDPTYRIRAHFNPPLHAFLDHVDTETIRQTMLAVTARQTTNGYDLTAMRPIPYAWYLLLVRDKNNAQWRASGYFTSGTNREPVHLHVDAKGMMHEGQGPIAMPEVRFLPDVVAPEFTAGWGEDSDGDGLPDIYEVLVTGTDPLKADTGNTGILDGYKEPAHDGWSNLEKFRRRADPFVPAPPPAPVILRQPTAREAMQALDATAIKTDLRFEPHLEIRVTGTTKFQAIQQPPLAFYQLSNPRDPYQARPNFDLRISWQIPQLHPRESGYHGP
jgi:hypothetical protein